MADVLPVDRFRELLDLVPDDALVAVAAEEELAPALRDLWEDVTTSFHDEDAHHLYVHPDRLAETLDRRAALRLSSISQDQPHEFRAQSADTAARSLREAEPELEKLVRSGYRTIVAWARRGEAERARLNLARVQAGFLDGQPAPAEPGVLFAHAGLREGFLAPQLKLAIVPEHRLLRRRRGDPARGPARRARSPRSPTCAPATPVVHEDHGIARFTGFETKTVGGITRDYLELEFRDGDRVFVPSDQLHKISRYVGADAGDPPLSKLGGKQWEQQKLRARRAAEALAGELINLYAERKRRAGHAFPHDGEWQMEFEQRFPYRETPDQLDAIEAVRADMEEARPMDRLICGDVGYGKTEVALRAAFKAAEDGKQVMFLVPTTVLAQQHFGTFTERLRDYPFRIEMVSRFRSAEGGARGGRGLRRGQGRHPDRHPPPALARRAPEGPRPADRGRGAALRRQAEGAAAPAQAAGGRAVAVGHADPAHAPDVAGRAARHLGDRDAARGPPPGQDLRRRVRRGAGRHRDRARARARGARPSSCTTASTRSTRPPSASARSCRRRACWWRTARWPRASSRRRCSSSCAATPTCSCARRSSSRASTSRPRTR